MTQRKQYHKQYHSNLVSGQQSSISSVPCLHRFYPEMKACAQSHTPRWSVWKHLVGNTSLPEVCFDLFTQMILRHVLQATVLTVSKLIIIIIYYYISHVWGPVVLQSACSVALDELAQRWAPFWEVKYVQASQHMPVLPQEGVSPASLKSCCLGPLITREHNIKVRNYCGLVQPTSPKDRCTWPKL